MSNGITFRSQTYPNLTFHEILPGLFHTFSQGYLDLDCLSVLALLTVLKLSPFITFCHLNIHGFNFIVSNYFHLEALWKESHHWLRQMAFLFFFLDGAWTIVITAQITDSSSRPQNASSEQKGPHSCLLLSFASTVIILSNSVSIQQKKKCP